MSSQSNVDRGGRTVRDLLEIVFRHKKKALLFFIVVVLSSLVILAFTPSTYTSTSTLMIRRGRESVFPDPTTSTGEMLPLYKEWESEVNSELEILNSHELEQEVIEQLGQATFLDTPEIDKTGMLGPIRVALAPIREFFITTKEKLINLARGTNRGNKPSDMDQATQVVENNLRIHVIKKSDIIAVSYTATSPELSQKVVSRLIDLYLEKRIGIHRNPGAHEFFMQQTQQLRERLKVTEKSIETVKQQAGIFSLEDNRSALLTAIEAIRTQQIRAEASFVAANAKVGKLSEMLQQTSGETQSALLDRDELKEIQTALRMEETTRSALDAELKELARQSDLLRTELAQLNTLETPIRALQREQELLENKYRRYSENQEQARINQALETQKISNVTIVQHATFPERPNPAGKATKLLAAIFLAIAGGVGITFAANALDPSLHSASEVSERLRIHTLIELPNLASKELLPDALPLKHKRGGARYMRGGKLIHHNGSDYFEDLMFGVLASIKSRPQTLVIGVTAGAAGEGVTSVASNLATIFARDGRFNKVMLLDANLDTHSRPLVKHMSNAVFTYTRIQSCITEELRETNIKLDASFLASALATFRKQSYDIIVVDIPPISEGGYAAQVAAETDAVILVVESGHTPWRTPLWASRLLTSASAKVCGVVLNRQHFSMPNWLYRKL